MKTSIVTLFALLAFCAMPMSAQTKSEATRIDDEASVQETRKADNEDKSSTEVRKVTRISNTIGVERGIRFDEKGGAVVPGASKGIRLHNPTGKKTQRLLDERTRVESPIPNVSPRSSKKSKTIQEKGKEQ